MAHPAKHTATLTEIRLTVTLEQAERYAPLLQEYLDAERVSCEKAVETKDILNRLAPPLSDEADPIEHPLAERHWHHAQHGERTGAQMRETLEDSITQFKNVTLLMARLRVTAIDRADSSGHSPKDMLLQNVLIDSLTYIANSSPVRDERIKCWKTLSTHAPHIKFYQDKLRELDAI